MILVIFFFATGNNEKKIFIMKKKTKKNWCRNLEICYCPICIVRKETVLQYSLLVLDCIAGCKAKLYCKRGNCIAIEVVGLGGQQVCIAIQTVL